MKRRNSSRYTWVVVVGSMVIMLALYWHVAMDHVLPAGVPSTDPEGRPSHQRSGSAANTLPLVTTATELLKHSNTFMSRTGPFSSHTFQYIIRSTKPRHDVQLKTSLSTWAHDVDVAFVASDVEAGLIRKVAKEPNHDLGRKALRMLSMICALPARRTTDFFVYADDDTFVAVPNLELSVSEGFAPSQPLYGGCAFMDRPVPLVSSGGGIVFSRATIDLVCPHVLNEDHACSWQNEATYPLTGDQAIAECMLAIGVRASHIHGFNQLNIRDITALSGVPCQVEWLPKTYQCFPPVSRLITARCTVDEMRELNYFVLHMVPVLDVIKDGSTSYIATEVSNKSAAPADILRVRQGPFTRHQFAYVILTTVENHGSRLLNALTTWARGVHLPFVVTDVVREAEANDMQRLYNVALKSFGETGKHELGKKTIRGLTSLCEPQATKADFFVFVDDDCFVFVPTLEAEVSHLFDPTQELYLGASLTHLAHPFASGGAGVVLSAATMRRVCEMATSPDHTASACHPDNPAVWTKPGDTAIGDCMSELKIPVTHHDGFHPLPLGDSVDYEASETSCNVWWIPKMHKCRPPSSTLITSHYTSAERFPIFDFVSRRLFVDAQRQGVGAWRRSNASS